VAKVAKAVVGGVVAFVGFITGNPALAKFGYMLIVSNALDVVAQSLADSPKQRALGQDIEYSGTVEPGWIIYGEVKCSGMNVIPPWTSGTKNQDLHQVLVLAAHRVHDITDVYFGSEEIPDASIGPVTGTNASGVVTAVDYEGVAWIRRRVGLDDQDADFILNNAFTEWTSNHKGLGNAYIAIRFRLDEEVYDKGKPEVSCIVHGKRCYQASEDTSPGAHPTDAAYITYTTNPADIVADYLLNFVRGYGEDADRIDWDSVVAAAAICDENVTVPGGTQKRYTCNVRLKMPESVEDDLDNLRTLAGAMMGHIVYRAGKWRIHAGAAATANFALTADDLVDGKYTLRTEVPDNEKYNRVHGQFVDADRDYQLLEFEPIINTDYETDDGSERDREVLFLACNNQYEAQRNAIIVSKRSRLRQQFTGTWSMAAFKVRVWDVGTITIDELGWDEQPVRCIAWSANQDGTIEATFLEEDETVWEDPEVGDYSSPGVGAPPTIFDPTPDPVAGFTVTGYADRIVVNAELDTFVPGDRYNLYQHTSASPFSSATKVVSQSTSQRIEHQRTDTSTKYYWMTVTRFPRLEESDEMPQGNGVPGAPTSVTTGFRLTADRSTHLRTLIDTGVGNTNNTTTVTPVSQAAAPTYAWTRQSGSTKVSVIASTSATTGFRITTGQSLIDGETAAAVFRCTATSAGASPGTATLDVSVTFKRDDDFLS
jgi:hypothetical protein